MDASAVYGPYDSIGFRTYSGGKLSLGRNGIPETNTKAKLLDFVAKKPAPAKWPELKDETSLFCELFYRKFIVP